MKFIANFYRADRLLVPLALANFKFSRMEFIYPWPKRIAERVASALFHRRAYLYINGAFQWNPKERKEFRRRRGEYCSLLGNKGGDI